MIRPAVIAICAVTVLPGALSGTVAAAERAYDNPDGWPEDWAVWTHYETQPAQVAVAPAGRLTGPWRMDSSWRTDRKGAWKRACWLVRVADITGRRHVSQDMTSGAVTCDDNCNCRF